jgi:glycerol-3-phosphate dehydrogenase
MKKAFPIGLMIVGLAFLVGGAYTTYRGLEAKDQVQQELLAQNIVTTPDASIPNAKVQDAATAQSMADVIEHHMLDATGGETYAEMDRFLAADGGTTSDEAAAMLDEGDNPVANPLRNVAFQASALRTSLYTSVMAFNVADLVIGLGLMIAVLGIAVGGVGVALGALAIPRLGRRLHVEPVVAKTAA